MTDRHVIEQAVFDFRFDSEEQALAQQAGLGMFIRDDLLPVIDEVFSAHAEPGTVFRFDSLEIDLGVVGYDSFRDELKDRLRDRLREALTAHLFSDEPTAGSSLPARVAREEWEWQQVSFFLERGYLPWNAAPPDARKLEEMLLRHLRNNGPGVVRAIRSLDRHDTVLRRIVNQFSDDVLVELARVIRPSRHDLSSFPTGIAGRSARQEYLTELLQAGAADSGASVLPAALRRRIGDALQRGDAGWLGAAWPGLCRDYARPLLEELLAHGRLAAVRKRIAGQFPETVVKGILLLLEPGESAFIEVVTEKPELFRRALGDSQDNTARSRRPLWEFTLGYLIAERGSVFNRKAYLGSLVRQMAAHANLDFRELLVSMHQMLVQSMVATPLKAELLELLDEIAAESSVALPGAGGKAPEKEEPMALGSLRQKVREALLQGTFEELTPIWPGLVRDYPYLMRQELHRLGNRETVRRRIAERFPEAMIREILLLEPAEAGFVTQVVGRRELFRQAGAFIRDGSEEVGKRLWEFTLAYQLEERGSSFNKKSYMGSLLRQMAAHDNLDPLALMRAVYGVLDGIRPISPLHAELLMLVGELIAETARSTAMAAPDGSSGPLCPHDPVETVRQGLIRRGASSPLAVAELTGALDELAGNRPEQLARLFQELQEGEAFRFSGESGMTAQLLRRLIDLFLLFRQRVDAPERAQFLAAMDEWAARSVDPGRFFGQVLERLVRNLPIDCAACAQPAEGATALPGGPRFARMHEQTVTSVRETPVDRDAGLSAQQSGSCGEAGDDASPPDLRTEPAQPALHAAQEAADAPVPATGTDSSTGEAEVSIPLAWRPDNEPEELSDEIYIANAGLVLTAPYLPQLFGMFGLLAHPAFVDAAAAEHGVHLLQYLADKGTRTAEPLLVLNKILCGVAPETPVALEGNLSLHEMEVTDGMIDGIIQNWHALGATTPDSFRETFLQREGVLRMKEDGWHLLVEPRAYDLLLDQIPWSFSIIRYSWMPLAIHVDWRPGL